jgi:alkanesulfonate monooxygenase SsuD/methylene tetrahydromethanopterin reductase-like flavin-dependent oxidoreductase (luciferase family)
MVDDYLNMKDHFAQNKKIMVSLKVILRDTQAEAESLLNLYATRQREKDFSIVGTEDFVKEKIIKLEQEGVTDILFNIYDQDSATLLKLHKLVNDLNN